MRRGSFGEDLESELNSLGYVEVLRLQKLQKFHILDRDRVSAWLLVEEAKAGEREEARSEESLSISRKASRTADKALVIAKWANIWAAIAALIAAIAMYIAYIAYVGIKP